MLTKCQHNLSFVFSRSRFRFLSTIALKSSSNDIHEWDFLSAGIFAEKEASKILHSTFGSANSDAVVAEDVYQICGVKVSFWHTVQGFVA
uniref:Uncharacterized protein n=1 Tax=Romanomermis culicivorax TaxID=13658 RepID=A0A915HQB6_ROMCU